MIFSLLILLPILGYVIWLYFRSAPKQVPQARRRKYDFMVMSLALTACLAVGYLTYENPDVGADRAWWPVIAGFYSWFAFLLVIIVGGVARNFLFFRSKRVGVKQQT